MVLCAVADVATVVALVGVMSSVESEEEEETAIPDAEVLTSVAVLDALTVVELVMVEVVSVGAGVDATVLTVSLHCRLRLDPPAFIKIFGIYMYT